MDSITGQEGSTAPLGEGEGTVPTPSKEPGESRTGAAVGEREAIVGRLDDLVAEGVMVKFNNRDGLPMWGFPMVEDHAHNWASPKIKDWWVADDDVTMIETEWYCTEPGCKIKHRVETAIEL
jgi:hypothetical protein